MSARATFRMSDLKRALKEARAEGRPIRAVRLSPDGEVSLEEYEPPAPPPYLGPCVYVFQVRGFDLVKIGYSTNADRRLAELGSGSGMGRGIVELFRIPGPMSLERAYHQRFSAQRLFGEWFSLAGPLAQWVAAGGVDAP